MPEVISDELVERLFTAAEHSAATRTGEADLRSDLFLVLGPFVIETLGLRPSDVRQEGTGTAGRFDSMFGRAIIEYKRPGLLGSDRERESAATQAIGYLRDITLGAQVVIITDGVTWGFLRDADAGPEPGEQGWLFGEVEGIPLDDASRFAWRRNSLATARRVLTLDPPKRTCEMTSLRWSEALSRPLGPAPIRCRTIRLKWPAGLRRDIQFADASVNPG